MSSSTISANLKLLRPCQTLLSNLNIPNKLMMGPGPSNIPEPVRAALSQPVLGHLHKEFLQIMDQTRQGINYLFQTSTPWTFALSGTGHLAMEASLANLVAPNESVLICSNGIWGQRAAEMCRRLGRRFELAEVPPGSAFTPALLADRLTTLNTAAAATTSAQSPRVVFITHGESSTGVRQTLHALAAICHEHDCLLLVDSVAAAGGEPLLMDEWGLDLVYTGSQKCLGSPPGVCPIALSPRAWQRISKRSTSASFTSTSTSLGVSWYTDFVELANYWGCAESDAAEPAPRRYHHTGPVNSIYGLRESLRLVAQETLQQSWQRHRNAAKHLWERLTRELGLELFVESADDRLVCVTTIKVPDDVCWKSVVQHMMDNDLIEIAGGLGPTAGKVWRIGLMGVNATQANVDRVVDSMKRALQQERAKK